ncbi:MAG: SIR2 family protein [Bacilli bacterium]|nr:SIR2 family protein [Bacilli bacterium]
MSEIKPKETSPYSERSDFTHETVVRFLKKGLVHSYARWTGFNDIEEALKADEAIKATLKKGQVFYEFYTHYPFKALNDYFRNENFKAGKIKIVPRLEQSLLNKICKAANGAKDICYVIVEYLSDAPKAKSPLPNLQIWGFDTLYSLLRPYFELNSYEGDPILELIGRRDLIDKRKGKKAEKLSENEIKKAQDAIYEELKNEIRTNKNFKLVLGNGLSIPFGAKSWSKLVDGIYSEVARNYLDHSPFISKGAFNSDTYAITEIAELKLYSDKKRSDYYRLLYKGIYGEFDANNQHPLLTKDRSLFDGVVSLMKRHEGLKAVTFNYDEYLEMGLLCDNLQDFTFNTSLSGTALNHSRASARIAHIHGKMPYHFHGYKEDDVKDTCFILTETEYLSFYGEHFDSLAGNRTVGKWQKESLNEALQDGFLMLGLSFRDIYLRRALYESKDALRMKGKELPKRYIFLSSLVSISGQLCKLTYDDRMTLKIYFDSFGITPLFFDTYAEMKEALENI